VSHLFVAQQLVGSLHQIASSFQILSVFSGYPKSHIAWQRTSILFGISQWDFTLFLLTPNWTYSPRFPSNRVFESPQVLSKPSSLLPLTPTYSSRSSVFLLSTIPIQVRPWWFRAKMIRYLHRYQYSNWVKRVQRGQHAASKLPSKLFKTSSTPHTSSLQRVVLRRPHVFKGWEGVLDRV